MALTRRLASLRVELAVRLADPTRWLRARHQPTRSLTRKPGLDSQAQPRLAAGSHSDSQPPGGRGGPRLAGSVRGVLPKRRAQRLRRADRSTRCELNSPRGQLASHSTRASPGRQGHWACRAHAQERTGYAAERTQSKRRRRVAARGTQISCKRGKERDADRKFLTNSKRRWNASGRGGRQRKARRRKGRAARRRKRKRGKR